MSFCEIESLTVSRLMASRRVALLGGMRHCLLLGTVQSA